MKIKSKREGKMSKKGLKGKIVAGLAALAVFVTSAGLPVTTQTVHAEDVGLPTETNTSFIKAREIEFGTSIAGTFSPSDSKRYYKFSLEQAGRLDLGLERTGDHSMLIQIYDASQTEIYNYTGVWTHPSFSLEAYLTGGDYYVILSGDYNEMFSFVVNVNSMGESFTETQDSNNDMVSDASSISLKKKYKGVLAQNDDIDYFKFQVPSAGKLTFNMTNSVSGYIRYGFYDQSLNLIYTNTVKNGYKISYPISVKKGTYYLAIAKEDVNKGVGSYTFSIDYTKKVSVAPKLKSVKNSSNGSITVKWGSVAGATGYELWYSTNSNFKSRIVKNELNSATTSAVYYGLTKKKKYYVKVRAYEEINGIKEYGKWSSKKSVTIKK